MKRVFCGAMVVLGLAAMQASAEKAGPADANSDGKITKQEFCAKQAETAKKAGKEFKTGAAEKLFATKDLNGDGVLTKDEMGAPKKPKKEAESTGGEE
jgi:hypothetical protein